MARRNCHNESLPAVKTPMEKGWNDWIVECCVARCSTLASISEKDLILLNTSESGQRCTLCQVRDHLHQPCLPPCLSVKKSHNPKIAVSQHTFLPGSGNRVPGGGKSRTMMWGLPGCETGGPTAPATVGASVWKSTTFLSPFSHFFILCPPHHWESFRVLYLQLLRMPVCKGRGEFQAAAGML